MTGRSPTPRYYSLPAVETTPRLLEAFGRYRQNRSRPDAALLWEHYGHIARHAAYRAWRIIGRREPLEALESAATLGLFTAFKNYGGRGQFRDFAKPHVYGAIFDDLLAGRRARRQIPVSQIGSGDEDDRPIEFACPRTPAPDTRLQIIEMKSALTKGMDRRARRIFCGFVLEERTTTELAAIVNVGRHGVAKILRESIRTLRNRLDVPRLLGAERAPRVAAGRYTIGTRKTLPAGRIDSRRSRR